MFERDQQGSVHVIRGTDPIDVANFERVTSLLDECLQLGQPWVVLDLEKVPLIDSAGLETLLDFQERFDARGGALKLAVSKGLCRDILQVTGIDQRFELLTDAVTAVGSFAR